MSGIVPATSVGYYNPSSIPIVRCSSPYGRVAPPLPGPTVKKLSCFVKTGSGPHASIALQLNGVLPMLVTSPEQCHKVFQQFMVAKDIDGLMSRFTDDAILIGEGRSRTVGKAKIREVMESMIFMIDDCRFDVIDIIQNGDVALERLFCSAKLKLPSGEVQTLESYSTVVLCRQQDGNWLSVIDDGGM
jgi:ketosteroid isomerase-like protein